MLGDCNPDLVISGGQVEPSFGQVERAGGRGSAGDRWIGRDHGLRRRPVGGWGRHWCRWSAMTTSGASCSRRSRRPGSMSRGAWWTANNPRGDGRALARRRPRDPDGAGNDRGAVRRARRHRPGAGRAARPRQLLLPADAAPGGAAGTCSRRPARRARAPRSTPTGIRPSAGTRVSQPAAGGRAPVLQRAGGGRPGRRRPAGALGHDGDHQARTAGGCAGDPRWHAGGRRARRSHGRCDRSRGQLRRRLHRRPAGRPPCRAVPAACLRVRARCPRARSAAPPPSRR